MTPTTPEGMKKALQRRYGMPDGLFAVLWEDLEGDTIMDRWGGGITTEVIWQQLTEAANKNSAFGDVIAMSRRAKRGASEPGRHDRATQQAETVRFIDFNLSAHQEQCSRVINAYYASRALSDQRVADFRAPLFGDRWLTYDEAEVWIQANMNGAAYEQLQEIARALMRDFGWRRLEDVEQLILTKRAPAPFAIEASISSHAVTDFQDEADVIPWEDFRHRVRENDGKRIPANQEHCFVRNTITITVAPWVSQEKVAEAYNLAQDDADARNGLNHSRRLSERSLTVFEFVTKEKGYRGKGAASRTVLKAWNANYPQWIYNDRTDFYDTYISAKKALILAGNGERGRAYYRAL